MQKIIHQLFNFHQIKIKTSGWSMKPLLHENDILYLKKTSFKRIEINDIVSIKKGRVLISHRVIYKTGKYLITKGDNNLLSDGKIYPKQIVGKVVRIKRKGEIFDPENIYLLQSSLYFQETVNIKKGLNKVQVDYALLKGLPLHLFYEKNYPRRIYLDCDILIKKKDFKKVKKILFKNGYLEAQTDLSKTHQKIRNKNIENTFLKIVNGFQVAFDLHLEAVFMMTQLGRLDTLYPQKLINQFTQELLKTKRKIIINNEPFWILNTQYLILYLALHIFHHNYHGAFRYDFLDKIWRKSKITPTLINQLIDTIKKYRLENFIYPVFVFLKKYYKTPLPNSFFRTIQPPSSCLKYLSATLKPPFSLFNNESRIKAGITRFKNLFWLSSNPLWKKFFVFFNPQVVYSIFWVFFMKVKEFFSSLNQKLNL